MAVYFLLRTDRAEHFTTTDDDSVLDWFRRHFDDVRSGDDCCDELGFDIYGLMSVFEAAAELRLEAPDANPELIALIEQHLYVEGDAVIEEHFIHANTDDDEVEIEYFIFDEALVATADGRDRLPSPRRAGADDDDELFDDLDDDDDDDDDDSSYASFYEGLD